MKTKLNIDLIFNFDNGGLTVLGMRRKKDY